MSLRSPAPPSVGEVAPGVHRLGSRRVNWYVVEADGRFTVVDAGLPAHYEQLPAFLDERGATLEDVGALVLTHGHADHLGFAERLRQAGVPVYAHPGDDHLFASGGGPLPRFFVRNCYRPSVAAYLLEAVRGGGRDVPPVAEYHPVVDGETLPVPGAPRVVHVPGHSPGQCALWFPASETLLAGDSVVTWDVRTGRSRGPMLPPVLEDGRRAFESLSRFDRFGVVTLLSGHGDPWRGAASEAVQRAWTSA